MSAGLPADVRTPLQGDRPLSPGDRLSDFLLLDREGTGRFFSVVVRGKPIVVFLIAHPDDADNRAQLTALGAHGTASPGSDFHCICILRLSPGESSPPPGAEHLPGLVLLDPDVVVPRAFGMAWEGLPGGLRAVVLDANQRMLAGFDGAEAAAGAAGCLAEHLRRPDGAGAPGYAPVLMIPRVLEPEFCRQLIHTHEEHEVEETGVVSTGTGGAEVKVNHSMKQRFDYRVRDPALEAELQWRFARRVLPEMQRTFWYDVVEAEECKVGCYRAGVGGYFRVHRDNDSPAMAYRRFAMSINLNTGEYEGGALRFPEYGSREYVPGVGDAVVFSCSLLHEVTDVTRGQRFVLLTFLIGQDGTQVKAMMEQAGR